MCIRKSRRWSRFASKKNATAKQVTVTRQI